MTMHIGLISYHLFNVTAEGLQAAKIARILRDAGHRVDVYTSDHNWLEGDRVQLREGPLAGLTIYRVAADPAAAPAWWRHLCDRETGAGWRAKAAAVPNLAYGCQRQEWAWAAATADAFLARAVDRSPDLLHTRLNPHQSHLAGLRICRRLRTLPWCAYFSDPWPPHRYPPPYTSSIGRLLRWRLERRLSDIHRRADSLVFPSRRLRDHQADARAAIKSLVAPHVGNVWHRFARKERSARLHIRHAGFLTKERRIEAFLEALRRLFVRRPEARRILRIEMVGRYPNRRQPRAPEDLADIVRYERFRRPDAIWSWLAEADVLLLVEASMEVGIFFPSKLADYLGAKRPILALSPQRGVAADLLGRGASGRLLAPPDDPRAIERAVETVMDAWHENRLEALLPPHEARQEVAPARVLACYEEAFARAMEARR